MRFPLDPAGYPYRPLKKGLRGWDVLALQSAFDGLVLDGIWGSYTETAVRGFQTKAGLTVDGIAGILTQRAVVLRHVWPVQAAHETPSGLIRGQIESESSFQVGETSPRYEDGTYDLGVVQQHFAPTDENCVRAFKVPSSIGRLGKQLAEYHAKYVGKPGVPSQQRAWELAAGSWNAPAWTDLLAEGKPLSSDPEKDRARREHIESYIDRVTVYMVVR